MSDNITLCLRGLQVNPKPRPKDFSEKSATRYHNSNGVRPYSANYDHKIKQNKQFENASRPKSANDISHCSKHSSKHKENTKMSLEPKKLLKCVQTNGCEVEHKRKKTHPESSKTFSSHVRSSLKNEHDSFDLEDQIICSPIRDFSGSANSGQLLDSEIQNLPCEFVFDESNLPKEFRHEDSSCESLLECITMIDERENITSTSPHVTAIGMIPVRISSPKDDRVGGKCFDKCFESKNMADDGEIMMLERYEELETKRLPTDNCVSKKSVEENSNENIKSKSMENNLLSLLVDLENDMISNCHENLQDELKISRKKEFPSSSMNFSSCLLEDDFPTLSTEVENEIKLFKTLCAIDPHDEKEGNSNLSPTEQNENISNVPSTEISSNLLQNTVLGNTDSQITSQIDKVDKILEVSRDILHEDIVEMLKVHENNFQLMNGCKDTESTSEITERPSCVGGSLESWSKTPKREESKSHTDTPNCTISATDIHRVNEPDSNVLVILDSEGSYKHSCFHSSGVPISDNVSANNEQNFNNPYNIKGRPSTNCQAGNFDSSKNDESSDDDSTYDDILTTLKVLEKEERDPVLLSSRPPPTGSESEHTPRVKLKDILSFLDDVDQSCNASLKSALNGLQTLDPESFKRNLVSERGSDRFVKSSDPGDLESSNQLQEMRLQEQAKGLALLKKELEKTKEKSVRDKEKLRKKMEEEHANVVMRHQEFIEKLLAEKKVINEKCEALVAKLQKADESHKSTMSAMEERHSIALRNERERARLELRAARDRWIREKTQKIQTATAKGAEGEVKRLVTEQAYQIEALWKARLDELRGRLEREAEEGMAKEREVARKRLEERVEEMERFRQEERRKFLAEECLLRGRAEEAERRMREVEEEARKRLAENLSTERAQAQANLAKAMDENETRYQIALNKEKAKRDIAIEAAKKEERELMEIEHKKREAKLKEQLKLERDRGIEKAVVHLTRQAEKAQLETEARTEMTIRRMRERCDEQVQIAETEAEKERKQCAEIRSQFAALQEENSSLKTSVSRLEKELETAHKLTTSLYEERSQIRELVVEEWSARIAALREEVGVLKAQVIGEKERREMELAQVQKEREHELVHVQKRVEIAIAKKEETINHVKSMYEAALKKCSQLQELLDKQRKDLLLK